MAYLMIGTFIGLVMGLTGSGGALSAIPLFMTFLGMDLKSASTLSLVAVVLASFMNLVPQRRFASVKLALTMFAASLIGSGVSAPLKEGVPELGIAILLGAISLFSLYSVWTAPLIGGGDERQGLTLTIIAGLLLGVLTTLTGLGGGVLLMPLLVGPLRLGQENAVPTALLTMGLASLASIALQVYGGARLPSTENLLALGAGVLGAAMGLNYVVKRINPRLLALARKLVFTGVVGFAMLKIFQ